MRVKDIDFEHLQIQVWNGKGYRHRLTTLAPELMQDLQIQVERVRLYLQEDSRNEQFAGVYLPSAMARKYPAARFTLGWQYLFPSAKLSLDRSDRRLRRHHLDESTINKFIRKI